MLIFGADFKNVRKAIAGIAFMLLLAEQDYSTYKIVFFFQQMKENKPNDRNGRSIAAKPFAHINKDVAKDTNISAVDLKGL